MDTMLIEPILQLIDLAFKRNDKVAIAPATCRDGGPL